LIELQDVSSSCLDAVSSSIISLPKRDRTSGMPFSGKRVIGSGMRLSLS
jgi:hypothetical protein